MRCRWVYLVFLLLLLEQLAEAQRRNSARTRNGRNQNRNQVQSRIVGGTSNRGTSTAGRVRRSTASRRNGVQSRIVSGNTGSGNRRTSRANRSSRSTNRRNINSTSSSSRTARNSSRNSSNRVSSRIVNNSAQARIIGGSTTSISTMPYLVQVHRGTSGLCGGALLTTVWVLSAGHCVSGYTASDFYVIAGTTTQNGTDGVSSTVSFVAVAPRYTSRSFNMDASLLKLNTALSGTNVATISLAQRMPRPGTQILVGGWGSTREGGSSVTNLRSVRLTVVRQSVCRSAYSGTATITRYMFCARGANRDSCSGDSGGPAVQNGRVFGIVSFGRGCARSGYPGVYTRASTVRAWVSRTIANN